MRFDLPIAAAAELRRATVVNPMAHQCYKVSEVGFKKIDAIQRLLAGHSDHCKPFAGMPYVHA